jgi:LPXTG-site transpeptidase (sortase) family protein
MSQAIPKQQVVQLYRDALAQGIPIQKLDHKLDKLMARQQSTKVVETEIDTTRQRKWQQQLPLLVRVFAVALPVLFLGTGMFLVGSAVLPIATQLVAQGPGLQKNQLLSPIPREEIIDIVPAVIAQGIPSDVQAHVVEPKILNIELDYTNLNNWFTAPVPELAESGNDVYYVDIPKLDIEKAEVQIGGTNLNQGLIQYPGTADPGELGAPVIFGHSVLRQFYNPSIKNKNRYNSIFSYIMTLDPGDEIYITHQGVKYTYRVREKTEVKPEDTYILAQQRTAKNLKLVTCTPEGTYLRRGVVTATLVE